MLPSGLATDSGSAPLRRLLLTRCDVDALVGFDNHRGIFPIHRSVRFLLLTASPGRADASASRAASESTTRPALERIGDEPAATSPWFPVQLSPALLERISGDGL